LKAAGLHAFTCSPPWLPYHTAYTPDRILLNHGRRQLTVRLPHELCAWLDQQAEKRLLDRSTIITDLLVQAMRRSDADA
jgi:hypothetical protein